MTKLTNMKVCRHYANEPEGKDLADLVLNEMSNGNCMSSGRLRGSFLSNCYAV